MRQIFPSPNLNTDSNWYSLAREANTYSAFGSLIFSLISFQFHCTSPNVFQGIILIPIKPIKVLLKKKNLHTPSFKWVLFLTFFFLFFRQNWKVTYEKLQAIQMQADLTHVPVPNFRDAYFHVC